MTPQGIHHITAMCGTPQRNVDFYTGLLGMRLVKVSVNQDDPGIYHLYYGDAHGTPGSIITFFPWPSEYRGRTGLGEAAATAYTVPTGHLDYWRNCLTEAGVAFEEGTRFGENYLSLLDPDEMIVELIESNPDDRFVPYEGGGVPADSALRGFHSTTLWVADPSVSERFLVESWGFRRVGEEDGRIRLAVAEGRPHQLVDLERPEGLGYTLTGVGTVHHVAFRAEDDASEVALRTQAIAAGLQPTEQIERFYFRSVYFREPGHILFEIATDQPGFAVDEAPESLGERLVLPPWLEPRREEISMKLPHFTTPQGVSLP
ncbi:MAG: ring-cleaving dioxygenase [Fimbriimonadaceae bacterium]|nr:ring-cleaving dioxygenase [Fimbriimonadaceae bacterium]